MLDRNVHRAILLQILKETYSDHSLGPILGLKGGTAAHLFYGLGRFSVDLDFDLLDESKENYIFDRMEAILKNFGTLKEKYKKRHTVFFLLSYNEQAQNIKVEVDLRSFGSRYEVKTCLGISMLVMVKEDMFAHKLVAMLERRKLASRDIYDVWFFLKSNWQVNKEIIERRTGIRFSDHLKECVEFLESLSNRGVLSGMGELLDEKQKVWAKANLLKDVSFLLRVRLEAEK